MSIKIKYAGLMMRFAINFWGPFVGAGIKVVAVDKDFTRIEVSLREKFYNRNIVGVHFGGSLYAMCDPFFMGILLHHLGQDFIVWDKRAQINFKKPGKGTLTAIFEIPASEINSLKAEAATSRKVEPVFSAVVRDANGDVIAEVEKTLYIKSKTRDKNMAKG